MKCFDKLSTQPPDHKKLDEISCCSAKLAKTTHNIVKAIGIKQCVSLLVQFAIHRSEPRSSVGVLV